MAGFIYYKHILSSSLHIIEAHLLGKTIFFLEFGTIICSNDLEGLERQAQALGLTLICASFFILISLELIKKKLTYINKKARIPRNGDF